MKRKLNFTASRVLAAGFALMILIGAGVLCLPVCSRDGRPLPFLDALFTATSASCVTGLSLYDTWTQFSAPGQAVILILIQIGGLGFMTFAMLVPMALGRRVGLRERFLLMEMSGSLKVGGILPFVRRILLGTLIFEAEGAALLAIRLCPLLGPRTGLWYAVFHSVSAFCNAGFDLMGSLSPGSSLAYFRGDALVVVTVTLLILIGGIGFLVWDDAARNGLRFKKYTLHSKLVLSFSAALILVPAALFLLTERASAFGGMAPGERLLNAVFCAVTPRTAGFSTIGCGELSDAGLLLTTVLMFIGAAPGSTGGGVKLTTFAVLLLALRAHLRRREEPEAFRRRLPADTVRRAWGNAALYLAIAVGGCFLLAALEPLPLRDALFESFSALGTVGLSTGITAGLGTASRLAVIIMMYAGRVGSLTVFLAMAKKTSEAPLKPPVEDILIG